MKLEVVDMNLKKVAALDVETEEKSALNKALLYYALKAKLNNKRHGTVRTKTRSEVNRTNKKVFRQKGTGNARHGARSANIFVGGGNVHGPLPRSYFESLNKSAKLAAYKNLLSYHAANHSLRVVQNLNFDKPSTKKAVAFLKGLDANSAVVVVAKDEVNAQRSFRNIRDVKVIRDINLSLIDLANYDQVVMSEPVFKVVKERYGV